MRRSCLAGERATWPKLSRVRDRCAIELALDRAVHSLKARVVFSKSQADLRRMMTGTIANTVGGNHEPLNAMVSPMESLMTAKEKLRRRHRRSSGSNLQPIAAHKRHAYEAYEVTDDDTDQEERLEMASERSRMKPKMRIKRLPNDHLQTGPKTAPHLFSSDEPNAFDFAKSPPSTSLDPCSSVHRASTLAAVPLDLAAMHAGANGAQDAVINKASSTCLGQQTTQPDGPTTVSALGADADMDRFSKEATENGHAENKELQKACKPKLNLVSIEENTS
jgi:TAG lipase/steryl ester hydrolase/phospholipase A2/LPA acyltransferase